MLVPTKVEEPKALLCKLPMLAMVSLSLKSSLEERASR
jgi:hypothetical protein